MKSRRFPSIGLSAALVLLVACGRGDQESVRLSSDPEVKLSPKSQTFDDHVVNLLNKFSDRPGWPPNPRRWVTFETEYKIDGGLQRGVAVNKFGFDFQSTTTVNFTMKHKSKLLVVKHTKGLNDPLYFKEGKDYYLNANEGSQMVAMCMYTAHLSTGAETVTRLLVAGTGVKGARGLRESTEVSQNSNFMKVKMGQTTRYWLRICERKFKKEVKASVKKDLSAATARMSYRLNKDQCGIPTTKREKFFPNKRHGDYTCWNVHKRGLPGIFYNYASRCVHKRGLPDGVGFCYVRGNPGRACRYYQDGELVTSGRFEYPCDKEQGLHCVLEKEPRYIGFKWTGYLLVKFGEARCRKR